MAELKQKLIKNKEQNTVSLLFIVGVFTLLLSLGEKEGHSITVYEQIYGSLVIVVFALSLIKFLINKNVEIPRTMLYWILFGCLAIVNVILAIFNGVTVIWWFRRFFPVFVLLTFALFSFVELKSIRRIFAMYIILVIAGLFKVIVSLIGLTSINLSTISSFQKIRGFSGGYYTIFTLSLIFPFLFIRNVRCLWKTLIYLSFTIALVGLFLSFTRTYWISSVIGLLFAFYLLSRIRERKNLFNVTFQCIFIAIIIILVGIIIYRPLVIDLFARANLSSGLHSLSFQDRLSEIKGIIHTISNNPLTILSGNGFGAKFTFYSVNPFSWGQFGWMSNDYSHNYYMYLLFDTGILGLSLFLAGWISLIIRIRKVLIIYRNTSKWIGKYLLIGIVTAIVSLLVASLTSSPLAHFIWANYFGILIGSAINLVSLMRVSFNAGLGSHIQNKNFYLNNLRKGDT
jgi:hypothetical protein